MKIKTLWFVLCALVTFCACDDSTSAIGIELVPDSDMVTIGSATYGVELQTVAASSVLARTSTSHLGNYTDPETGTTVHSDFLLQMNCGADFEFPEHIQGNSCTDTYLRLFYENFVGDSLTPCRVSVYPLTKVLDNSMSYYTDLNPEDYYDPYSTPIATTTFTLSDRTLTDSARYDADNYTNLRIKLPNSVGNDILTAYKKNPEYFANGKIFNEKVNHGYFVKFDRGDGVMVDVYVSQLNLHFKYFEKSSTGRLDSLCTGTTTFAGTEEVIQATAIKQYNIEKLMEDTEATYLKSPSGLYTEVTLPVNQISANDTINSAKIIFDRYNAVKTGVSYELPAPNYLLMVPKDQMYSFFEENKIPDNETSFMATFSSTDNNYAFTNIAHLITYMRNQRIEGMASNPDWEAENPNWNKVVLIPVEPVYSSTSSSSSSYYSYYYYYGSSSSTSSTLVGMNHDLSLSSARLKKNGVTMQVIYSKFNK